MKAPTKAATEAMEKAAQQAREAKTSASAEKTAKTTEPHFSEFYDARHEAFFCSEVIKMAAFAASAQDSLIAYDNAMACLPKEAETVRKVIGPIDWHEFPTGMAWSLRLAQQKMDDAHDRMEAAFMAVVNVANGKGVTP